jgi:hypothetical protein
MAVFLLPFLHFGACLAIGIGHIDAGWEYLLLIDFPFSIVIAGLMYRNVHAMVSFGILGTLWWYGISLAMSWLIRASKRKS